MNQNTKSALFEFINSVEILAQGVIHMTGMQDCQKLLHHGLQAHRRYLKLYCLQQQEPMQQRLMQGAA